MPAVAAGPRRAVRRVLGSAIAETLTTPHGVDRYLELFRPTWSLRDVRAEVTAVRHLTADSVTLTLRPNNNWAGALPGQYVRLTVEIDGVRRTRCYSIASSWHRTDSQIELTSKLDPGGAVSPYLNTVLREGMVVGLSQAEGQFTLPTPRPERLLLVSGGSGITPMMGMLRTLCDEGHTGAVTFLHYAFRPADVIYAAELAELSARHPNVALVRAFTEVGGGELCGLFHRDHLLAVEPAYAEAETYVCGPGPLMDAVHALWTDEGIGERLHVERFARPALTRPDGDAEGWVRFARRGGGVRNDGTTLLEQVEAAGLQPAFGCRMGICRTCTTRKQSGCARNLLTGESSAEEDEDIQLCISVPVGDLTLDI